MKVILIRSRAIDPAVQKYANSLAHKGYDVTLLVWDRKNQIPMSNNTNNYTTHCFKLSAPYDSFSVFFYYPLWFMYEFIFLIKNDIDIIQACDLDTLYPAIFAKIIRKKRLVYLIYDFYANNLPNGKFSRIRILIRFIVAHIEKIGIGFADLLILVDESRMEEVKGARINKLIYVYNAPEEICIRKEQNSVKVSINFIVIFYAGMIHEDRGIGNMIAAVKDLNDVELILAGVVQDKILDAIPPNSDHIKYIGWIPSYEEVLEWTISADILFRFSDPKHPKTKYESPNKLFEAMMCEKPIIVSDNSSMANIVRENNCGLVIPFGDIGAIKEAISSLRDAHYRHELGKNGRKAYEQKYSWKIMEKRLIRAYEDLLS